MADDFYPFVDSGDPAPDNSHITGISDSAPSQEAAEQGSHTPGRDAPSGEPAESTVYATRIAIYDDMLSTPRVMVVQPKDPRSYLEEVTNTVYRCMKEQGGSLSLMVIRELVENFIHAHFAEPIVSVLDGGNTIRFADQGPGINDKERAFEFGVTSANRSMKRYIRGTGAGLPMVQQYLENAGGAVSIEDNLGAGTVVTVSVDPARVAEIEMNSNRGAAVRGSQFTSARLWAAAGGGAYVPAPATGQQPGMPGFAAPYPPTGNMAPIPGQTPSGGHPTAAEQGAGFPAAAAQNPYGQQPYGQQAPYPQPYQQPFPPQDGYAPAPGYPATGGYPAQQGYPMQPYSAGFGYPQGYPGARQGFQQYGQKFSTIQQPPRQSGEMLQGYAGPQSAGAATTGEPFLTERGLQALDFLATHGQCGPTELTNAYGHSGPTWSRELATLSGCGFAAKHGRKYFLTELGSAWVAEHRTQE